MKISERKKEKRDGYVLHEKRFNHTHTLTVCVKCDQARTRIGRAARMLILSIPSLSVRSEPMSDWFPSSAIFYHNIFLFFFPLAFSFVRLLLVAVTCLVRGKHLLVILCHDIFFFHFFSSPSSRRPPPSSLERHHVRWLAGSLASVTVHGCINAQRIHLEMEMDDPCPLHFWSYLY